MQFEQEEMRKMSHSHSRVDAYSIIIDPESNKNLLTVNKSHENLNNHSTISRGRLRVIEASGDRSVISIDEHFIKSSCSRSRSKNRNGGSLSVIESKRTKRSKTPFDSTQIVEGHLMPIRINKQKRGGQSTFR
jgi:hypothetical protein